jgi:hypothetical protein
MPDAALLIMDVQNSIVERFADSAPSLLEAPGQAAADEEVRPVLLGKVFPRQADVLAVDEWVAGMER